MNYVVLSVYDRAAAAFGRPFFAASVGAAIRSFQDEVNRPAEDNPMNKHASDFDLFELGVFDDSSGLFRCLDVPRNVATGKQMLLPGV